MKLPRRMSTLQCKNDQLRDCREQTLTLPSRAVARKTFETTWKKEQPGNRGKYLNKLAELLERDVETLAAIEALDNGKSVAMAKGDIAAAAGCIRYYGGWADKIEGKVVDTGTDTFNYIRKEPVSLRA
jgi:aldehyde dehydrogenase (NAD+)